MRRRHHTCVAVFLLLAPAALGAQERLREPLPLDVAVSVRGHSHRAPIDLSPDGEWIAHTVVTDGSIEVDSLSLAFGASGAPISEGVSRTEAVLTNTRTGEEIRLGAPGRSSWSPVWSPDGSRVAFYCDEGGEAGVWVWDRSTRTATRFPQVRARTLYRFNTLGWTRDGERLLVKALPEGRTIAQANAFGPTWKNVSQRFPDAGPGEPSVSVRRAGPSADKGEAEPDSVAAEALGGDTRGANTDLVVLDLRTRTATHLGVDAAVLGYAFSPSEERIAFTVLKGTRTSGQMIYDLMVVDRLGAPPRLLAENVRMGFGIEWSWSPDGETIAYIDSGLFGDGTIVLVSVADGTRRVLGIDSPARRFTDEKGQYAPLWDPSGKYLYAVGDGELWRVDARSGRGSALGRIPGWEIRAVVQPFGRPVIWTSGRGRTAWVVARERDGLHSGLFAVDLENGTWREGLRERKTYSAIYNVDANERTGELAFVSTDQQHLPDVWLFDLRKGRVRQATHLNPEMERYQLGEARLIEWTGSEGESLRGTLLLPPGYRDGQRLPLVVWVYGGDMGSRDVNRFGIWGETPVFNLHVLATRGYAVLYPDVPVRTGQTMRDIYEGVTSAADAAVAQGYADPERLAIMGQSYGSFSTLAVITQTPRFKAAVITAAVLHPDLFADYLRGGQIGYYEKTQGNMGGTIWERPDRYRENSPIFLFDRIQTPLLIGMGERDGFDLNPPEAIFTALERLGKTVEYRVYEGEGHALQRKPNVLDFWKRRLEFLAEHLGSEPDAAGRVRP